MNKIYKVIWSKVKHQYVVVSELAHSNGKQSTKAEKSSISGSLRAMVAALMMSGAVLAIPYTAFAADVNSEYDETGNLIIYGEVAPELNEDTNLYAASTKDSIIIGDGLTFSTDRGFLTNSIVLGNNTVVKTNGEMDLNVIIGDNNTLGNNNKVSESVLIGSNSTAKAGSSVTIGSNVANGSGVAIGYNVTGSNDSVAIGKNSNSAIGSVAIGNDIKMNSNVNNGVAIGNEVNLLTGARGSVAIGYLSNVEDTMSVAIGQGSDVKDEASAAIGSYTKIGDGSVSSLAIGGSQFNWNTQSITTGASVGEKSSYSSAIGVSTKIGDNSEWSTAVGAGASIGNDTDQAAAFGNNANVKDNADYSLAAGYNASVAQGSTHSTAVGSWAKVGENAQLASAFGYNTQVGDRAIYSVAMGTQATVGTDDEHSLVLGTLASAGNSNDNSIVAGYKAKAGDSVVDSTVIGANSSLGSNVKNSVAVGNNSSVDANVEQASVYGYMANASKNYSTALGGFAKATGQFGTATGYNANAGEKAVAEGAGARALADNSTAIGSNSTIDVTSEGGATLGNNTAIGSNSDGAIAIGGASNTIDEETTAATVGNNATNAITMGTNAIVNDNGRDSIAIGNGATINDSSTAAIAIGLNASTTEGSNNTIAIGQEANAGGVGGIAIGQGAHTTKPGTGAIAIGIDSETTDNSVVMGQLAKATSGQTVVLGPWAESHSSYGAAIGRDAYVGSNSYGIALGGFATVGENAMKSIAIGASGGGNTEGKTEVKDGASYSIAMGGKTTVGENAEQSVAIGGFQATVGDNAKYATAVGTFSDIASGVEHGTAIGYNTNVDASYGTALGNGASANGAWSTALGASTDANYQATAVGGNAQALGNNSVAIGVNSTVSEGADYSVALGTSSEVNADDLFTQEDLDSFKTKLGDDYNADWNISSADGKFGVVSVGLDGNERRIINVAKGRISADSTDAINGSQLRDYAVMSATPNEEDGSVTLTMHDRYGIGEDYTVSVPNTSKWNLKVDDISTPVNYDDTVEFRTEKNDKDATNLYVKKDGLTVTVGMEDDITLTGVTADRVSVGEVSINKDTGIDAGGFNITNVKDGEISSTSQEAVNGSQLYKVQQSHTTMTVNEGTTAPAIPEGAVGGDYTEGNLQLKQSVGQNGQTQYDIKLNDNIVLGDGEDQIKLNGAPEVGDNAFSIGDKFAIDQQGNIKAVINSGFGGTTKTTLDFDQNGIKVSKSTGDNESSTSINGGNLTVEGVDGSQTNINGDIISAGNVKVNNEANKDTITGLSNTTWNTDEEWQAANVKEDRAATEGQLQDLTGELEEVATEAGKHTTVTVNGGMTAPEDGSYTHDENGKLDGNLLLKQTNNNGQTEYDLKLNPDLTLQGEDGSAARVEIGGTNGTITVTKNAENMNATTTIDGGNIYAGSSVTVGDIVKMTDKDITGLSNTTWDGTTDDVSRAATEGQLQAVSNEAGKHTTVTVNGGMTAPEDGSYTHDENGKLDGNLLLKQTNNNGQTEYDLKLNPDLTLQGEDGSAARVEIGGTNGTITVTKNAENMNATTTIDGGNIYAGSSVTVGDIVKMTDKDITGLSNTTWDGTTDDVSRAATEGQLKDVSDTVNAGWIATDNNGNQITVNPTDNTLNFSGDRNVTVTANKEDGSIDVALNDDIVLGGQDGSASRVEIGGTNGTIMVTKNATDMSATTTIDGGNIYAGSSVTVGDTVRVTDKDITGLSNTTWDGTTDDVSRAATEGQLKTVSDNVNAGWIATDNNGNQITVNPEDNTLNFSGDRNVTVEANKEDGSIDVSLNDDIVLGGKDGSISRVEIGGTNGTIMATTDFNDVSATTTINGGNVYVGSSVSVGDKVVMTDKDITGLSNTTWNGTTDDASRAATEGQLQSVSDMVIGGWTATDDEGNKVKVNPENSTLNFSGDENVTVTADDENSSIDVKLNDKLNLGDDQIIIDGSNGNASITLGDTINLNGTEGTAVFGGVQVNKETGENTIIGLTNTEWSADGTYNSGRAATEEQLGDVAEWAKDQINDSGWTASTNNGAEKTDIKNGNVVDFSSADDNIKVSQEETDNGTNITFDLSDDLKLGHGDNGAYVDIFGSEGKVFVGNGTYNITIDGTTGTIGGLSNTTWNSANDYSNSTQAATEAQLQQAVNNAKQEMTDADRHLATNSGTNPDMAGATYAPDENGNVTIKEVDGTGKPTGNEVVISNVASASDVGDVGKLEDAGLGVDKDGNSNVVDAILDVNENVGDLNYVDNESGKGNVVTNGDSVTDAIGDLDAAIGGLETDISGAAEEAKKHNTVEAGSNIILDKTPNENGGTEYKVSVDPNLKVDTVTATGNIDAGSFTSGDITINKDDSGKISGLDNTDWNWKDYDEGKYKGSSNAATEGQLHGALEGTIQYDKVTDDKGNVTIDKTNITLNKGGDSVTIHNVANGKVEEGSTDAVNGGQLYEVQQGVVNNSNAINNMGNQVNRLSNRIDKVGAGAAALAALHPLDFDPDDKLSFAAGYGNYAGENAVAVGAFYQPNEDTMFSVGGTFGNDENMVNAGVSFKLGQKSNVSRSRVSMAKELVSLRDEVAQLKALMAHAGILPSNGQLDTSDMFPDVPENHWAYEYIHELAKLGIVDGYPDGNFEGDRMMTRYEMAAIVYRAMQKGVNVDSRMLSEFEPELKLIRVDVVARDDDGNPTIERVRVNDDTTQA